MLIILVGWHHPLSDGFTVQGQDPGICQGPNGEECKPNGGEPGSLPIIIIVSLIAAILGMVGGIF